MRDKKNKLTEQDLKSIFVHHTDTIENLKLKNKNLECAEYYNNTNYSDSGLMQKASIKETFIKELNIKTALDVSAYDGKFSKLLSNR